MNYVQHSWVFLLIFSNVLQNVSSSLPKGALGRFLQGIDFLLNDVPLDILVLTGTVLGMQRKEDLNFDLSIFLPDLSWF